MRHYRLNRKHTRSHNNFHVYACVCVLYIFHAFAYPFMPAHIALAPSAICRLSGDPTKIYSFTLSTSSTRRARWYDGAYECFGTSKCKYRRKQTSKLTATYACMCVDMCNAVHVNMLLLHMYLALWYLAANHPLSRCK